MFSTLKHGGASGLSLVVDGDGHGSATVVLGDSRGQEWVLLGGSRRDAGSVCPCAGTAVPIL
jgi:hypothetical protein